MSLTLAPDELAALADALRALVSPLDEPDGDAWHRRVLETTRRCVQGDTAFMVLPQDPGVPTRTEGIAPTFVRDYVDHFAANDEGAVRVWSRRLSTFNLAMVVNGDWDRFRSSELFNDLFAPHRILDQIGVCCLPEGDSPAALAGCFVHSARSENPLFAERGLALARLLLPAFRAGVQSRLRLAAHRAQIATMLDLLPQPIRVVGAGGKVLHQNPALTTLLSGDSDPERLEAAIRKVTRSVERIMGSSRRALLDAGTRTCELVVTPGNRYRVSASLAAGAPFASLTVLAMVQPLDAVQPDHDALRRDFALTKREAEVTALLAQGQRNDRIAQALSLSPRTVRRHTERILAKLRVTSRAEVPAIVLAPRPR